MLFLPLFSERLTSSWPISYKLIMVRQHHTKEEEQTSHLRCHLAENRSCKDNLPARRRPIKTLLRPQGNIGIMKIPGHDHNNNEGWLRWSWGSRSNETFRGRWKAGPTSPYGLLCLLCYGMHAPGTVIFANIITINIIIIINVIIIVHKGKVTLPNRLA